MAGDEVMLLLRVGRPGLEPVQPLGVNTAPPERFSRPTHVPCPGLEQGTCSLQSNLMRAALQAACLSKHVPSAIGLLFVVPLCSETCTQDYAHLGMRLALDNLRVSIERFTIQLVGCVHVSQVDCYPKLQVQVQLVQQVELLPQTHHSTLSFDRIFGALQGCSTVACNAVVAGLVKQFIALALCRRQVSADGHAPCDPIW